MDTNVDKLGQIKFQTINGNYLLEEIKEEFDNFKLKGTDIEIQMRPRTGIGKFTNFSKRCRVVANGEGDKYSVGDEVWLPHRIADSKIDGARISPSFAGKNIFRCGEHNIMFTGSDLTQIESDEWVIFQIKKGKITDGDLAIVSVDDDTSGVVVSGALPKGTEITWYLHKRQEFYQREIQYWVAHIDHITEINGEINTKADYYKIDTFEDYEVMINGLFYSGQAAKLKERKLSKLPVKHFIAHLQNSRLPYHDQVAIVRQARKGSFVHRSEVLLILENSGLGIESYKPVCSG